MLYLRPTCSPCRFKQLEAEEEKVRLIQQENADLQAEIARMAELMEEQVEF